MQLRKMVGVASDDREISVGDFLNKGPASIETLRFIAQNGILAVRGNHEDKFIRYHHHQLLHPHKNPMHLDSLERRIYEELTHEDIAFLQSLPLYLKEERLTVVHAGVLPATKLHRLDKNMAAKVMRVRFVDDRGGFVPLDRVDMRRHFWWSELYDGRYGFVVYGHQPFFTPRLDRFSIGIDTGCVYGHKLTALVIEDGCIASMRIVQIACREYAKRRGPWIVANL